jgi:hypothetical protein
VIGSLKGLLLLIKFAISGPGREILARLERILDKLLDLALAPLDVILWSHLNQ